MKISGIFLRHAALFMAATAVLAFSYFSSLRCSDLLQPDFGVRRSFSRFYKDEATGRAFKAVVTNIDDKKNLICREIYEYDPATSRRTKYTKEERFKDGKKLSIKEYDYLYDEDGDRSEFHVMVTQPGREGILKGTYRYDKRTGHVWNSRSVLSGKNGQVKSDRFFEYDKEERPVLIKKTFMDDAGNIAKNIEQKIE
jgi:hypothetical protein